MWIHRRARTLKDLRYGQSPTKALKKHSIAKGHEYSILGWTPEPRQSWSLTVSSRRLKGEEKAIEVGLEQVKEMCEKRIDLLHKKLEVIVGDGHYGNHQFLGGLKGVECAGLVRLRKDRVLYGSPPPLKTNFQSF